MQSGIYVQLVLTGYNCRHYVYKRVWDMVKVNLSSIIEGIEFQGVESQAFLRLSTGEVVLFTDEEINTAERNEDMSDHAEWYIDAIERAKEFLKNEKDYIALPSKYDFHEYSVIEKFIFSLPIEEQQEELLGMIKGRGAFSRFRQGLARFLLVDKWYEYRDSALTEFAKDWCDDNKIELNPATKT